MKNQSIVLLLTLVSTLAALPFALTVPTLQAASTRHFDIYQNNSTNVPTAHCSGQPQCFNSTSPGPTITVNKGDTVSFTVHNNDTTLHSFTFISSPYSVNVTVTPGTTMTVSAFTANTVGSWSYQCIYHPVTMKGTFTVNPVAPITPVTLLGLVLTTSAVAFVVGRRRR